MHVLGVGATFQGFDSIRFDARTFRRPGPARSALPRCHTIPPPPPPKRRSRRLLLGEARVARARAPHAHRSHVRRHDREHPPGQAHDDAGVDDVPVGVGHPLDGRDDGGDSQGDRPGHDEPPPGGMEEPHGVQGGQEDPDGTGPAAQGSEGEGARDDQGTELELEALVALDVGEVEAGGRVQGQLGPGERDRRLRRPLPEGLEGDGGYLPDGAEQDVAETPGPPEGREQVGRSQGEGDRVGRAAGPAGRRHQGRRQSRLRGAGTGIPPGGAQGRTCGRARARGRPPGGQEGGEGRRLGHRGGRPVRRQREARCQGRQERERGEEDGGGTHRLALAGGRGAAVEGEGVGAGTKSWMVALTDLMILYD